MHEPLLAAMDGVMGALFAGGGIWLGYERLPKWRAWRTRPAEAPRVFLSKVEVAALISAGCGFFIMAALRR